MSLYFRSNLNFKIRDELMPEPLESIVVEIMKPRTRPIIIGTLYIGHRHQQLICLNK